MAEGWQRVGGSWYYLSPGSGAMAIGWKKVGGIWYYLDASGAMKTGWQWIDGEYYYLAVSYTHLQELGCDGDGLVQGR